MKSKTNKDIREAILNAKVKYYEVADVLGIKDSNFSRLLRYELCKEYKEKILTAIESIQERN